MSATVDGKAIDYSGLPDGLRGGMQRYIEERIQPGDFLLAVLTNNLRTSLARADETNKPLLEGIVRWLYNNAPGDCWGSVANVHLWLEESDL